MATKWPTRSQIWRNGRLLAEARAGELLLGVGIPVEQHYGPMSEVAPGWKLRVLLAQALFSNPDILLLDEPTNNPTSTPFAGWSRR